MTQNEREKEEENTIALIINHFMKALMTCWMQTYKAETLVIDLFYIEAFNCRLIDLLQIVIWIAILGIFENFRWKINFVRTQNDREGSVKLYVKNTKSIAGMQP